MRELVTWQDALVARALCWFGYVGLVILALICAVLGWSYLSGIALLLCLPILGIAIPIHLNHTRSYYKLLFGWIIGHLIITLSVYAWQFARVGLRWFDGTITHAFSDGLYFSVTTWTTVGYGDLIALPQSRLLTSLEALTGLLFMPLLFALFWFAIQESTVPYTDAYLDRKRHRFSAGGDILPDIGKEPVTERQTSDTKKGREME